MAGENINRRINIWINDREVINSSRSMGREMRRVRNEIENLEEGAENYNEDLQRLTRTYRQLEERHNTFRQRLQETPGILDRVRNALGPVAAGMLAAFSVTSLIDGFVAKITEAWGVVVDFDQKQADLAAIMGTTRTGIVRLTADAIKYGSTTSYNAAEVSVLQTELARLGKTEKEIRGMTKAVLESATALESELGPAAELIGGQLNSYQEDASQAQKYSDIMANSVNVSATSFESLSTALPKVSKVAYLTGVTFEKVNGILGVLADESIAAETAGTGFRNILLTAAQAGKPYEEMLKEVNKATDKTAKATELFGKENATVAVIMATSTDKIESNTRALENSAGAAEKLAKEKMNSITGSIKNFSSAWEGAILNLEKGDGVIAKIIKKVIDLGTSILGLINPTKQLSDEIFEEQLNLNKLVSQITSSNISNDERKRLLMQLKEEYPDFIKNIDIETVSNGDLNKALVKVNDQYVKRIALQKLVQEAEKLAEKQAGVLSTQIENQQKLFEKLVKMKIEFNLDVKIDRGSLEKSAKQLEAEMTKKKLGGLFINSDFREIDKYLSYLKQNKDAFDDWQNKVDSANKEVDHFSKQLGINTEAQNENNKSKEQAAIALAKLRIEAESLGMKNAKTATLQELKQWMALYEAKIKYSSESEEEKKAREKAAEKRKSELEKRKKETDDLNKLLLETERAATDARLDVLADGYEKERRLVNNEFEKKIEDLERQKIKEAEIDSIKGKLAKAKTTGNAEDITFYQNQLDTKVKLNEAFNERIILLEQQRGLKIAAIQEKYLKKEFTREQEANASELTSLKIKHNNEIAQFTSFQSAKTILSGYLNSEELKKITTLEGAKKKLKEVQQKEELQMQERHLYNLIAQVQGVFAQEEISGIKLISPEERAEMLKFLDEAALKLSEIKAGGKANEEKPADDTGTKAFNGLDILGTTVEQWDLIFTSLDTFGQKMQAISAISQGMQQAFGAFFDFLDARDQRSLQKYERNSNKKKKELSDQLEKGYITQEVYNARMEKLDLELAKKKAEIEYKEAKRRKALAITQAIISTAQGVAAALQGPPPASYIFAGITAGMGALQIATIATTPLPSKEGFKKGGYTGNGNPNDEAGPVHKREYVIPEDVLFDKDPAMPHIMGYIETKRKRKRGFKTGGPTSDDVMDQDTVLTGQSTVGQNKLLVALERNTAVLERLELNGIDGFIVIDSPAAKKIKDKIKQLETIQNGAKL